MGGMTSANIVTAARVNLQEAAASIWSDANMTLWATQVVREISRKARPSKRTNLSIVEYTNEVDLGSLTYFDIEKIEYPVGLDPDDAIYVDWKQIGQTLQLLETDIPTITDGTLTGTVTWVPGSRSVSGASTLFTTELEEGYLIQVGKVADAAYKWYTVLDIISATSLILMEPFEEATTADTISLTKYRDKNSCVRLSYTGEYTVTTTSDMPAAYDELAILGVVAHAAQEFAAGRCVKKLTDIETDLTSARTVINTINAGGKIVPEYTNMIIAQTGVSQLVSNYKAWANDKWNQYQEALSGIRKVKSKVF